MGWILVIVAGALFWAGPQVALAGGEPWFVAALFYVGWVLLLLALLRWLLPTWHWLIRLLVAFLVPVAIAAVFLGAWLRLVRGRD